jgi:hypothetical protein
MVVSPLVAMADVALALGCALSEAQKTASHPLWWKPSILHAVIKSCTLLFRPCSTPQSKYALLPGQRLFPLRLCRSFFRD